MNLIHQLMNATTNHPIAIFYLKNNDFIIASFHENEEEGKTLLINPMVIISIESDTEEGLTLEPYISPKIIEGANFFIDTDMINSIHRPSEGMFKFYIANIMKLNGVAPKEQPKKKAKKEAVAAVANTANNVLFNVDFNNRKEAANSLVNIYKEGQLFIDLKKNDDPDGSDPKDPSAA